jgi:hypothetical protein
MMRLNATPPGMTIAREAVVGLAYLAAYVLLDRVSLHESYAPLGTTPWNPSSGLSFVLILACQREQSRRCHLPQGESGHSTQCEICVQRPAYRLPS